MYDTWLRLHAMPVAKAAAAKKVSKAVKKAPPKPRAKGRTQTKVVPEDRAGKGGNTTLLTKELSERLINTVSTGVPLDVAIAYCGIHRETLRRWRRRGDKALEYPNGRRTPTERRYADFVTKLDTAMAETTVLAQAGLRQLMTPPRDRVVDPITKEVTWVPATMSDTDKRLRADAIKFYLSRRERKHYGPNLQAELTGPNGGPVLSADLTGEEAWEAFIAMFGDPTGDDNG